MLAADATTSVTASQHVDTHLLRCGDVKQLLAHLEVSPRRYKLSTATVVLFLSFSLPPSSSRPPANSSQPPRLYPITRGHSFA